MVWRTPCSVQFGVDVAHLVIDPTTVPIEKAIAVLKSGISEASLDAVAAGCGMTRVEFLRLVEQLHPVMEQARNDNCEPNIVIALNGMGFAVESMATALKSLPQPPVILRDAREITARQQQGQKAQVHKPVAHKPRTHKRSRPSLSIHFSHYVAHPEQFNVWLRNDVPHIPVVFSDTEVRIGPVLGVSTGGSPCAMCLFSAHRDADPHWPAMATQLLGKESPSFTPYFVQFSTTLLAHYISAVQLAADFTRPVDALLPLSPLTSIRINVATGLVTQSAHAAHQECACQQLPRNRMSA